MIDSVAAARYLMPLSAAQRRRRQSIFFAPEIALRRSIGQGVHDRLEAAVFADGEIDPTDETGANRHFPFPAKATSVLSRTVAAGECWDVSVRGAEFGLDDLDDLLVLVNVGELVLEPGAQLAVQGNLLVLVVQRLVVRPARRSDELPPGHPADAVLGRSAPSSDPGAGRDSRPARDDGADAGRRPDDTDLRRAAPAAAAVPGAEDGRPGTDGTAGTDGRPGASGGPSKLADLSVAEIVGPLVVSAPPDRASPAEPAATAGRGPAAMAPAVRAVASTSAPATAGTAAMAATAVAAARPGRAASRPTSSSRLHRTMCSGSG